MAIPFTCSALFVFRGYFIPKSNKTPKAIPAQIDIGIASIWVNLTAQKLPRKVKAIQINIKKNVSG